VGRFSVMMESKICFFFFFLLFSMDWNNAGGWGVLRSFSVYSWNFRMVLRRLHAEYGVNAFFRVDVVAHPNFPDKSIVRVSFSFLSFSFLDIFANSVECVCLVESPFAWRFGPAGWPKVKKGKEEKQASDSSDSNKIASNVGFPFLYLRPPIFLLFTEIGYFLSLSKAFL
jgi:hypothetical protein